MIAVHPIEYDGLDGDRATASDLLTTSTRSRVHAEPTHPLDAEVFAARQMWLTENRISIATFNDDANDALEALARQRVRSPKLADAHVAAVCIGLSRPLLTYNVRDFDSVEELRLVELR